MLMPRRSASWRCKFSSIKRSIIWLTRMSFGGRRVPFSSLDRRTKSSRSNNSLARTTSSSTTATMPSSFWYWARAVSGMDRHASAHITSAKKDSFGAAMKFSNNCVEDIKSPFGIVNYVTHYGFRGIAFVGNSPRHSVSHAGAADTVINDQPDCCRNLVLPGEAWRQYSSQSHPNLLMSLPTPLRG